MAVCEAGRRPGEVGGNRWWRLWWWTGGEPRLTTMAAVGGRDREILVPMPAEGEGGSEMRSLTPCPDAQTNPSWKKPG